MDGTYVQKHGDNWGGQLIYAKLISECHIMCDDDGNNCKSFEYSDRNEKCKLNRKALPSNKQHQDYLFCTKAKYDPEANPGMHHSMNIT